MFDDFVENTYIVPIGLGLASIILWIIYIIMYSQKKDLGVIQKISTYFNILFLVWALVFLYLTIKEQVFQDGELEKTVLKAIWPLLLALVLIIVFTFIKKYRTHPAGIFASSLILLGGFYLFIKMLS